MARSSAHFRERAVDVDHRGVEVRIGFRRGEYRLHDHSRATRTEAINYGGVGL